MKILVLGSSGQMGSELVRELELRRHLVVPMTHADADIRDSKKVASAVQTISPDVVVNTSAFHDVEACESEVAEAFAVNAIAVRELALICAAQGAELVHFSTDYVFEGTRKSPYEELDLPRPLSIYGTSKLAGELLALSTSERTYVVRTCGLYGVAGRREIRANFVERIIQRARQGERVQVVNDQVLTPSSANDVASCVAKLLDTGAYGIYHITNEGECSWYDFAKEIFDIAGMHVDFHPQAAADLKTRARRPAYSVLSKQKLYRLGIPRMPDWRAALALYMRLREQ
jgi:dTDP-4-dehydrorhamnose reductase